MARERWRLAKKGGGWQRKVEAGRERWRLAEKGGGFWSVQRDFLPIYI